MAHLRHADRSWTLILSAFPVLLTGCFPTMQTAGIREGVHVAAGTTVLSDQVRNGETQGTDIITWIAPSYGFAPSEGGGGVAMEVGLPVGYYLEEGLDSFAGDAFARFGTDVRHVIVMPYLKLGLVQGGDDKLAVVGQAVYFVPASISLLYGREFPDWTPHITLKRVFSAGPAGDDPFVTRYQERNQSLWVLALGAEMRSEPRPHVEIGVLRNHYEEGFVYGFFGGEGEFRTLYDGYVALQVGF